MSLYNRPNLKNTLVALIILATVFACSTFDLSQPLSGVPQPISTRTPRTTPAATNTLIPSHTAVFEHTITPTAENRLTDTPTATETVYAWQAITPTPDVPRVLPTLRSNSTEYVVRSGDTLNQIARTFTTSLSVIAEANQLQDINLLNVGQVLVIPPPNPQGVAPDTKVIPDSELVFGPASVGFEVTAFIQDQGGYLASYQEEVGEVEYEGAEIIDLISRTYSVNPRLLLALLEFQSGWLTQADPDALTLDFPLQIFDARRSGLYQQIAWAANELNRGYYLWRVNALPALLLADGTVLHVDATINAGTAAVQHYFAQIYDFYPWQQAIAPDGLLAVYTRLFGSPFALAVEPLIPPDLEQPFMQLPFEPGKVWRYTGGPHGGWGGGSAWAALDFAPPGKPLGCVQSDEWVVAVADGLIVRSEDGHVIQDLSGDGHEQTGWVVFYLHIETRNRVEAGVYLKAGERVGHPSCEGGYSTGTHVHIARRYNGEWISADGSLPFVMEGWVPGSYGRPYYGYMMRAGQRLEALTGLHPENAIQRD
jgi:LasA protease